MFKIRLKFSKTGRARFLSHLDVMRVFQRALTRVQAPVEYSNGFNPHMRLSIAFPLPLGVESVCELLDLQLEYPFSGLAEKLNSSLPEGFSVLGSEPLYDIKTVTHIVYELTLDRDIENIFDGRSLKIMKKTKRGMEELDIAPYVKNTLLNGRVLTAALSIQNPAINPSHVLDALRTAYPDIQILNARRVSHESYS